MFVSSSCFQSSLRSLAQELSEEYSAHAALPHRSNGLTTVAARAAIASGT